MDLTKAIKTRASIRNFSSKKVNYEKIINAIEAANHAPSPGNLPILKYIIIEDEEIILKISKACQQPFISKAKVVVVVCSDSAKINIMYDERADKYTKQHAGAAIENFLLKITDMGLSCCWVGAFSELTVKNLLKIPDNINVEAILPVGYALKKEKQKKRTHLENLIYFNTWKNIYQLKESQVGRRSF